jgi:hypothetical protein
MVSTRHMSRRQRCLRAPCWWCDTCLKSKKIAVTNTGRAIGRTLCVRGISNRRRPFDQPQPQPQLQPSSQPSHHHICCLKIHAHSAVIFDLQKSINPSVENTVGLEQIHHVKPYPSSRTCLLRARQTRVRKYSSSKGKKKTHRTEQSIV